MAPAALRMPIFCYLCSMNYTFYISRRLSLSSAGRRSTPAVKVAVAAVAISIAVMLASIAIVLGFKNEIRGKIIAFNSDLTLYCQPPASGEAASDEEILVDLNPALTALLDSIPYVTSYSLETSMPVIMKTKDDFKGVYLKGKAPGADMSIIRESMVEGKLPSFSPDEDALQIVISRMAASQLGLKAGDKIDTYFITDEVRVRRLTVAGVFDTHFENYDDVFIFGNMKLLQELAGIRRTQGTSLKVTIDDFSRLDEYTADLRHRLLAGYAEQKLSKPLNVENAQQQGEAYFQWLNLLDTNVIVILALMIAVACITLISGMLILIIDKTRFIGIVRSLGMSNRAVGRVFTYLSLRVALWGVVIGNAVMLTLLTVQHFTHFIPLDADAYYLDYVPVSLDWMAFLLLNIATLVVIFLTLLLPSRYVSRISPSQAMRFE